MDRLSLSLSTMGVGMLVVFSGLVILIACITIMTSITGRKKAPKAPKAAEAAPTPKTAPAPAAQAEPEPEADDGEIIAAITAAIAAVWQAEGNESGFVVRRVRRTQSASARARAAREEQIFSHF